MSKELIKEKLNKFGSKKEPFLFVISYDLSKFYIEKLSELPTSIKYEFNSKEHHKTKNKKSKLEKTPISFEKYKEKFELLQEEIKKGNSYLLNLTSKTKINIDMSLDEIFENTNAKFKLRYKNLDDDLILEVKGFRDPTGTNERNTILVKQRAENIMKYLKLKGNVSQKIINEGINEIPSNIDFENYPEQARRVIFTWKK